MTAVILTFHVLIVLALIVVVLLQRSDGGALGIGGGASAGGFMSGRGAANALTRLTSLLAAVFFATSLGLAIFAEAGETSEDIIEDLTGETIVDPDAAQAAPTTDDLLDTLGGASEAEATAAPDLDNAPTSEEAIFDALGVSDDLPTEGETSVPEDDTAEDGPEPSNDQ